MNETLLSDPRSPLPSWLRSAGLIALLMLSGVVFEAQAQPRVAQAVVSENGMLVIRGLDLARHGQPVIRAGEHQLEVCAQCATNSYVVARLPAELSGGREAIRFRSGPYRHDFQIRLPARTANTQIAAAGRTVSLPAESSAP